MNTTSLFAFCLCLPIIISLLTVGNSIHAASIAQEAYVKASNSGPNDNFGVCVAASGDTVAVSAHNEDSAAVGINGNQFSETGTNSGAVYVFTRSGTNWAQQAYVKASNTSPNDAFGFVIALDSDTLVVGAPLQDGNGRGINSPETGKTATNSGAAYIFFRQGNTWTQQAYLKASNAEINDGFGWAVAIEGDTVVVGARTESSSATGVDGNESDNNAPNSGAAYVFVRNGSQWVQQAYLKPSNTRSNDNFGRAVAISGETILVSSMFEDSNATGVNGNQFDQSATNSGAVYVFVRSGNTWAQQAYLKASNTGIDDRFGTSLGLSGNVAVISTPFEDSVTRGVNGPQNSEGAIDSGAAYVFVREGQQWRQEAYLKSSNSDPGDGFGRWSAIDGETIVIGAYFESSIVTGINNPTGGNDNLAPHAGAAYVFSKSGPSWMQTAYLKASNTDVNADTFGMSVAIAGNTVIVGAPTEDSNATGINGNQNNNTPLDFGAAYIFANVGRPKLSIVSAGEVLEVSWPSSASAFVLDQTILAAGGLEWSGWQQVPRSDYRTNNGRIGVLIRPLNNGESFRLRE
jgi:hypothetical protein